MFLMVDLVGVVFFELAVGVAGDALKDNGIDTVDETRDGDDDLLLDGGVHHEFDSVRTCWRWVCCTAHS